MMVISQKSTQSRQLKWNQDAEGALQQIREKRYPERLKDYGGKMLLVGINYDKQSKKHTCRIEVF